MRLGSFQRAFGWATLLLLLLVPTTVRGQKWVATWSAAPYAAGTNTPPAPYLENNTLRQVVRVSIGGDTLRLKFSNVTSATPVTLKAVTLASLLQKGQSAVDGATMAKVVFGGKEEITMAPYAEITSDPIPFRLTPGMHLAITTWYGACKTASDMTHHYGSRTDSYILEGNQSANATFSGGVPIERWYHIHGVEVLAAQRALTIAVLGNSITDGYGLHGGLANKWTDIFSERLLANPATSHMGVVNMGIGATWLITSGVKRFAKDILDQAGVGFAIVFYGVNDIGGGASAEKIIEALSTLISQAREAQLPIYGATVTPFKGHSYYSPAHEAVRAEVNRWIRQPGNFDGVLDFDKVLRDPADSSCLRQAFSNDWLHPNAEGYRALGESIDVTLFSARD
ncbi:MAG: SGNH/GDSL hydrolase family protein [Bacteroidales bacterium]